MKKTRDTLAAAAIGATALFFLACVLPWVGLLASRLLGPYALELTASFRDLFAILAATLALVMAAAVPASFASILRPRVGRVIRAMLEAIESVPAMLVALFAYAPFAMAMAMGSSSAGSRSSILVFCAAAAITALPETTRCLTIVLFDLYNRRYSFAFRSYGMNARAILRTLLGSREMLSTIRGAAVNALLKTLILDSSFGFLVQLGFGSYGRPAHTSPGALIASYRASLVTGDGVERFWIPVALLAALTFVFIVHADPEERR
jgi:ABC-type dipeptide/oligopeptide/nickel transport system permease subunit